MTATCLCLTILVLTTVNISNSSASWVLDLPDMFQLQALHPLAHGTKEKEEHGYPWLSVSAGSNHLQSLTRISVSGSLHQVRHSLWSEQPFKNASMHPCGWEAGMPSRLSTMRLGDVDRSSGNLSSVETITIPDTSRKYAGFVAPYQSTNGKACFETTNPGSGPAEPTKKPQSCISSCPRSVCSSEQNSAWNAACSTKTRQKLGVNKRSWPVSISRADCPGQQPCWACAPRLHGVCRPQSPVWVACKFTFQGTPMALRKSKLCTWLQLLEQGHAYEVAHSSFFGFQYLSWKRSMTPNVNVSRPVDLRHSTRQLVHIQSAKPTVRSEECPFWATSPYCCSGSTTKQTSPRSLKCDVSKFDLTSPFDACWSPLQSSPPWPKGPRVP